MFFQFQLDCSGEVQFTFTRGGSMNLVYRGFHFEKCYTNKDTTYWRCVRSRRKNQKCKAKARSCEVNGKHSVKISDEHNHSPDSFG